MFALSHGVRPDVFDEKEKRKEGYSPTFLCIQMILEYNAPPSTKVYLYRSSNWVRSNDRQFAGADSIAETFVNRSIPEFLDFHKTDDDEKHAGFDEKFMKWHAEVAPGAESTWKYRWAWTNVDPDLGPNTTMKNYLMRFTPLPPDQVASFVTFSTKVADVKRLTIRTFAPAYKYAPDLFDNQLVITFN